MPCPVKDTALYTHRSLGGVWKFTISPEGRVSFEWLEEPDKCVYWNIIRDWWLYYNHVGVQYSDLDGYFIEVP